MAFLDFKNVRIAGFSAGVPKRVVSNEGDVVRSSNYDAAQFVELTGVRERRYSETLTTSDLCYYAAERLVSDLHWDKQEIDALIFVSQSADYVLPATSCILQDRLGLSKECYCDDSALGCSGWVYGLSHVASLVSAGTIRKALLCCGDAKLRFALDSNYKADPLFGHAGTVTAMEYSEDAERIMCHYGTDGSGFDAVIIPDGGARCPASSESWKIENIDGVPLQRLQTRMNGMDVFSFGISTAPKSVKKLAEHFNFDYLDYDYFLFHQANMKMNAVIEKKLKLDHEKVPYSMPRFGNTSSASIPLTIVTELKGKVENAPTKFIACGFGVGLSWGTVAFKTDKLVVSELVEVSDDEVDKIHVV